MGATKGSADYYKKGDWNAQCFRCGHKFKAGELARYWEGFYVCTKNDCWEPRQPQDFVRGIPDLVAPPWAQPPSDIDIQICTFQGSSGVAGLAVAGCMKPGSFARPLEGFSPGGLLVTEGGVLIDTEGGTEIQVGP